MKPKFLLTDLPSTKALVQASVLALGIASGVGCGDDGSPDDDILAPTCGPCCHGGIGPECSDSGGMDAGRADAGTDAGSPEDARPPPPDAVIAPTCGPACHDPDASGG